MEGRMWAEFIMFWNEASGKAPVNKVINFQLPQKWETLLTKQLSDSQEKICSSSSSLARQPYVHPGLLQKLLPAEVSSYCFFRLRDKNLFQGGVVTTTPNPRLSWRANVFCQGCLP
jgi:hypothetical protein